MTNIQERVPLVGREHLRDHSFNIRVFTEMRRSFVGWDDGRGLSVCDRKNRL